MTSVSNIRGEFETMTPVIKADFQSWVRRTYDRIAPKFAGKNLVNVYDYDYKTWAEIRDFEEKYDLLTGEKVESYYKKENVGFRINEQRLEKIAQTHAEFQVDAFVAKLEKKLKDLDNVHIRSMNVGNFEFTIAGDLKGQPVTVHQQVVFKTSSHGKHFCQWPARIYMDGKMIPEAAFKKLA